MIEDSLEIYYVLKEISEAKRITQKGAKEVKECSVGLSSPPRRLGVGGKLLIWQPQEAL